MGRRARSGEVGEAVAGGLLASVATFIQLEAIMVIASPEIALHLWPASLVGVGVLIGLALVDRQRHRDSGAHRPGDRKEVGVSRVDVPLRDGAGDTADLSTPLSRPFALRSALVLAAVLTGALLLGRWASAVFGSSGVYLSAGAAGLADAHAGALASAEFFRAGAVNLATALVAIAAAMAANTLTKVVLGFSTGGRSFGVRLTLGIVPAFALFVLSIGITVALISW